MKIAMLTDIRESFDSLAHVYNTTEAILRQNHEVVRPPAEYSDSSDDRKLAINAGIIADCDLVLATPDLHFLAARERVGKHIPYLVLLLGGAPRGMPNLREAWRYLRTTDVLIGNCRGDKAIATAFFPNVQCTLLPFPFDPSRFFPLASVDRDKIKAEWGFSPKEKILLYAGRVTLEKNIHTLILIFSILQKIDANIHLIIAGATFNIAFEDFGVRPSDLKRSLSTMIDRLGVDRRRLHLVGYQSPAQLQVLYNIADVFVNMTLHHDENFGVAQVEAMACGTPVVGTNWGGLKDTILDAVTGHKVSTIVTAAGVKSNWLEAASKILHLLRQNDAAGPMRERCKRHVQKRYSLEKFRQNLEAMLAKARQGKRRRGDALVLSNFGRELWKVCSRHRKAVAPYRRGAKSLKLYQTLIASYAGGNGYAGDVIPADESIYLPWPISVNKKREIQVHDPMFPMKLAVPVKHEETLKNVLRVLRKTPVTSIQRLLGGHLGTDEQAVAAGALGWMLNSGILLTLPRRDARAIAQAVPRFAGKPRLRIKWPAKPPGKGIKGSSELGSKLVIPLTDDQKKQILGATGKNTDNLTIDLPSSVVPTGLRNRAS